MTSGYNLAVDKTVNKPQDYASDGVDGIGFIHFWGLSPAVDLVGDFPDEVPSVAKTTEQDESTSTPAKEPAAKPKKALSLEEMMMLDDGALSSGLAGGDPDGGKKFADSDEYYNVLLSGGADLRHVIKTAAKWHRQFHDDDHGDDHDSSGGKTKTMAKKKKKKLRFFLHDPQVEVTARHLLFLQILTNTSLTPRDRAEQFLTLYGNALVRERDSKYLSEQTKRLLRVASETADASDFLSEVLDFSCLKFKERDELENVLHGWKDSVPFDVPQLRDDRMRGYYRARYEYRKNLMDHDYQLNIKPAVPVQAGGTGKASVIHWYHYRDFCHTGVAFESRLGSYTVPNRSLASYIDGRSKDKGSSILVRGFWADIINSPYFTFGITTHNGNDGARLFKRAQDQHRNTAVDVSEFNLEAWIRELQDFEEFNLPPEKPEENIFPYATPMDEIRKQTATIEEVDDDGKPIASKGEKEPKWKKEKRLPGLEGCKIVLLTGNLEDSLRKSKFEKAFDRAYFGNMAVLPILEASGLIAADAAKKASSAGASSTAGAEAAHQKKFSLRQTLKPHAVVTCETMKYQVHFDGRVKLGYRARMKEAFEALDLQMFETKYLLPKLADVPSEARAKELEFSLPDFVHFASRDAVAEAGSGGGGGRKVKTTSVNMDELDD